MREYGSDFHYISGLQSAGNTLRDLYPDANYYADGRQALMHLYHTQGWQRLWMPEYFCYDVVASFKEVDQNVIFYQDYPAGRNDSVALGDIHRLQAFVL